MLLHCRADSDVPLLAVDPPSQHRDSRRKQHRQNQSDSVLFACLESEEE
jgi:hypothetical protein